MHRGTSRTFALNQHYTLREREVFWLVCMQSPVLLSELLHLQGQLKVRYNSEIFTRDNT